MSEQAASAHNGSAACPGCGAAVALEDSQCSSCGKSFAGPVTFENACEPPQRGRWSLRGVMSWIGVVALILGALRADVLLGIWLILCVVSGAPFVVQLFRGKRLSRSPGAQQVHRTYVSPASLVLFVELGVVAGVGSLSSLGPAVVGWLEGTPFASTFRAPCLVLLATLAIWYGLAARFVRGYQRGEISVGRSAHEPQPEPPAAAANRPGGLDASRHDDMLGQ